MIQKNTDHQLTYYSNRVRRGAEGEGQAFDEKAANAPATSTAVYFADPVAENAAAKTENAAAKAEAIS